MSAAVKNLRRLKYAVEGCFNGVWGDDSNGVDDLTVVRVADFNREQGCVEFGDNPTIRAIPTSARNRRVLVNGDLLIEKSGGGEQSPVGNVVLFGDDRPAVCSNFVARMPVTKECDARFVGYVFRSLYAEGRNITHIKQTSGIQNLDSESYLNEKAWLPVKSDQERIANFLDDKTARIDALITEKERLVAELENALEAHAFHLVTEGIEGRGVLTKRSEGWLARVPANWRVPKLGYFAEVGNGATPRREVNEYWLNGTIPWVTSTAINDRVIASTAECVTEAGQSAAGLRIVRPGSTIVGLIGQGPTRGMAAKLTIKATVSQNVAYVTSRDQSVVTDEYLVVVLTGLYTALRYLSDGSGGAQGAMNCETLRSFRVPIAPPHAQQALVDVFSTRKKAIESMQEHVAAHIARLREYRSSLISAAVTGQLDIGAFKEAA